MSKSNLEEFVLKTETVKSNANKTENSPTEQLQHAERGLVICVKSTHYANISHAPPSIAGLSAVKEICDWPPLVFVIVKWLLLNSLVALLAPFTRVESEMASLATTHGARETADRRGAGSADVRGVCCSPSSGRIFVSSKI
jgi:hypothetical protein